MKTIITRFPPSPTGYLHVGGARTALFNWLYARHSKGTFVLRIEDTDTKRSTESSVNAIFEALEWLGMDWDQGPFFQSRRTDIYKEYIQKLIDSGKAYYCTCSPEELDAMRKKAMETGQKPKYDGTCRNRGLKKTDNAVIRFAAPEDGSTVIEDMIRGRIAFQNNELDDFIICRSDGMPTYNMAVVVDDITMNINTVIRGDDHINNTPKQILLYKALGADLPSYAHVPMVLGADKTRLSKRHGAMSVTAYRDMGYLPDALLNYLVRLGWSYGDQEFFTKSDLIEKFTLKNIGKSAGVFNKEKLLSLNADHIKDMAPKDLAVHLLPFLHERGCDAIQGDFLENVIKTLNTRSKTLLEMADGAIFYFNKNISYDEKAVKKVFKASSLEPLKLLAQKFDKLEFFDINSLEDSFKTVMEQTGLKLGKIAQPVRVALTGKTVSPGIFEIIEVLGKEDVVDRLEKAIDFIEKKQ